jgi:hypothetical protein
MLGGARRYAQQSSRLFSPVVEGMEGVGRDDNHLSIGADDPLFFGVGDTKKIDGSGERIEDFAIGVTMDLSGAIARVQSFACLRSRAGCFLRSSQSKRIP